MTYCAYVTLFEASMETVCGAALAVAGSVLYVLVVCFIARVVGFNKLGHDPE